MRTSSYLHDPSFRTRMALKSSDKLEITEEILELFREQMQSISLKVIRHN